MSVTQPAAPKTPPVAETVRASNQLTAEHVARTIHNRVVGTQHVTNAIPYTDAAGMPRVLATTDDGTDYVVTVERA